MPTIIDTLIVKLGLDPKDLGTKSGEYDKKLKGLEGTTKKVTEANKEAGKSLEELGRSLGSFLAILGGTYAIKAFVTDTINANAALDRFSKNIGLSVTTVSAWGNAVEELGGNSKNLQGTMDMLSKAQTQLRLTGESSLIPFFARLGINLGAFGAKVRPVDEILLDLSDRFGKMDRTQANNMGRMLGLDQDTLNLLLQGRQAVELMIKRQKEHNAVTKAEAEQDARWQRSIIQLNQAFNKFGRDLLQQAAPAIEKLIGWLTAFGNWVQTNQNFIKDFLTVMAVGLAAIAIVTSPITLTTAAIIALGAAIALLWDDYQVWQKGGKSFIDWQIWKDRVDAVKEALHKLREEFDYFTTLKIPLLDKMLGLGGADAAKPKSMGGKSFWDLLPGMGYFDSGMDTTGAQHGGAGAAAAGGGSSIVARARAQAERISKKTGIPADLVYAQMQHESGNFTNRGATSLNNFTGINVPGGNGKDYRKFSSDDEFGDYLANLLKNYYPGTLTAKNGTDYAHALENGVGGRKYYDPKNDGESKYATDMNRLLKGTPGASSVVAGASTGAGSGSTDNSKSVQTGDINIFTKATDAQGIAGDINKSLNYLFTSQANPGLT